MTPISQQAIPLIGRDAFRKFLRCTFPKGGVAWFKASHNRFFVGEVTTGGRLPSIWETRGNGANRERAKEHPDGFAYLARLTDNLDGGCFFIPGKPEAAPLRDCCDSSDLISAEMDDGTTAEQWALIDWLCEVSGLNPAVVVGSGGKSLHCHFRLDSPVGISTRTYLCQLLTIALQSDPVTCRPHQPMRAAGFFRREKGKEQTLEFHSDQFCTLAEVLEGFQKVFVDLGYTFPETISDERWLRITRVLKSKEIGRTSKSDELRKILSLSALELSPPRQIRHCKPVQGSRADHGQRTQHHGVIASGSTLVDILQESITRLTPEQIFNWAGHNWHQVSATRWEGCCPGHASASGKSFILNPQDLTWYCHGPCSEGGHVAEYRHFVNGQSGTPRSKDFVAIVEQLASEAGVTMPRYVPLERDGRITTDQWHERFGVPQWLQTQIGNFKKLLTQSRSRSNAQPDTQANPELQPKTEILIYEPGKLPEYQAYIKMGSPVIRFEQANRFDLIYELREKVYPLVLDRSGTGSGKSQAAGLLNHGKLEVEQLWYVSVDHRNPTVPTVEANFADMPVRNPGLVTDPAKRTALNRHHVRWPRLGEYANIEGNCFQTEKFHALAEKGYDAVSDSAKDNPICGSCAKNLNCAGKNVEGKYFAPEPGASFRDERRQVFEERLIRSSPQSLPGADYFSGSQKQEKGDGEDKKPSSYGAIWDEIGRLLNPAKRVSIGFAEFDHFWAMVEAKNEELHTLLRPLRVKLRSLLSGEVDCTADTRHGFNTMFIRDWLADIPAYSWDELDKHLKLISPNIPEVVRDQKAIEKLHPNWLGAFLEVLLGIRRGAFTVRHGELHVATYDPRLANIVKATAFNLFLDTTMEREYLGLYLGIEPNTIAVIEQQPDNFSNLNIISVAGWGLAGHQRSDSFKKRKDSFKAALDRKYPGKKIVVLDFKEHSGEDNGNWFNHNRATNEFQDADVLAVFGTPYENLGNLQEAYLCISPSQDTSRESKAFGNFIKSKLEAEIAQTPGRLRANRRPDKQVSVYFCFDYDLGFLNKFYPGAAITQEEAFNICAYCGTISQQSLHRIQQRILEFARATGEKLESITQVVAAQAAGVTQGRISQIAAKLGGWQVFRQLLAVLLDSRNRTANISGQLDDEQLFMADTYLPLAAEESPPDAIGAMADCFQVYGWHVFKTILAATPVKTRGQLLAVLISLMPETLRDEFRAIASWASG